MKGKKLARKPKVPSARDVLKEEIANELGLLDKTRCDDGWGALTSAESGRIGGILGFRLRTRFGDGKDDE